MAKTLTELTDELLREMLTLKTQVSGLRTEFDQANLATLRERMAVQEQIVAELKRLVEETDKRGERLTVLETQFAEFKKQFEEKDRRWWQFWIGTGLVGFTFVANLVIQLVLLFSRKAG